MNRMFSRKKRNVEIRKQKSIILIVAVGKYVTESECFKLFESQSSNYNIRILILQQITDIEGMQERIEQYWNQHELDKVKGDAVYVVLDSDCNAISAVKLQQYYQLHRFVDPVIECIPSTDVSTIINVINELSKGGDVN